MFDETEEVTDPVDIDKFVSMLKDAWKTMPDASFLTMLEIVFNGYALDSLTNEEQEELLNEFILNNM